MAHDYGPITTTFRLQINKPGRYPFSLDLTDMVPEPDVPLAQLQGQITVNIQYLFPDIFR